LKQWKITLAKWENAMPLDSIANGTSVDSKSKT